MHRMQMILGSLSTAAQTAIALRGFGKENAKVDTGLRISKSSGALEMVKKAKKAKKFAGAGTELDEIKIEKASTLQTDRIASIAPKRFIDLGDYVESRTTEFANANKKGAGIETTRLAVNLTTGQGSYQGLNAEGKVVRNVPIQLAPFTAEKSEKPVADPSVMTDGKGGTHKVA